MGVAVEIRDLRTGALLGVRTVDLAAASTATVQVPWVTVAPDSHEVQVHVSPHALDESNFANNTASRVIVLGSLVGVDREGAPSRLRFDPPFPNPTSRGVAFSFAVPQECAGALDVYDILGRHVRGWRWENLTPGSHSVEWNGRDLSGHRLSPGVYLCRLKVGEEPLRRRVILQQ